MTYYEELNIELIKSLKELRDKIHRFNEPDNEEYGVNYKRQLRDFQDNIEELLK